jgi:hypothetical protein
MFKVEYGHMACKDVINSDNTGIWYNSALHTILVFSGKPTTVANA